MELETLLAGVGRSVQQAQASLDRACAEQYLSYFDPPAKAARQGRKAAGQSVLVPRTIPLALPGAGEERVAELPLLALCHHSVMSFDQVTVKLNVALEADQSGQVLDAVPVAAGQGGHQIELVFRRQEPAEAVARFNQAASQIL